MKELVLQYEWKLWTNKETGEVKKYRVFFIEWNGIKIPIKAGDNTAQQILNQIFDNLENE